ncbi:hypothetical protein DPMN_138769, partial [Dreissena polymorpha]
MFKKNVGRGRGGYNMFKKIKKMGGGYNMFKKKLMGRGVIMWASGGGEGGIMWAGGRGCNVGVMLVN